MNKLDNLHRTHPPYLFDRLLFLDLCLCLLGERDFFRFLRDGDRDGSDRAALRQRGSSVTGTASEDNSLRDGGQPLRSVPHFIRIMTFMRHQVDGHCVTDCRYDELKPASSLSLPSIKFIPELEIKASERPYPHSTKNETRLIHSIRHVQYIQYVVYVT